MRYLKLIVVLLLVIATAPANATTKKPVHRCRPSCTHARCGRDTVFVQSPPQVEKASELYDTVLSGLFVDAGFRWESERDCPTRLVPVPSSQVRDPFYVGLGLELPLAPHVRARGTWDREFTQAPEWQARAELVFFPFK
jgi:hypothetical protein